MNKNMFLTSTHLVGGGLSFNVILRDFVKGEKYIVNFEGGVTAL